MNRLYGKVAVITGGSSGKGFATAEQFVSEGAYVYITGRREKELDTAVAKIGKNIAAVQGDVSNLKDLDRLYAKIAEEKGRVDVVFANAGIGNQMAPLGSITEDLKDRSIRVNAISPGYTETSIFETLDWTKEQFEEIKSGITKTIPLGRWAHSEEIAKAAVFLASEDSSYVAGIELFVDGGAVQV